MLGEHLCVPFGLGIDNTRDFILEDPLAVCDAEETNITVAPENTMDYFYESMLVYNKKKKIVKKTYKIKKRENRQNKTK